MGAAVGLLVALLAQDGRADLAAAEALAARGDLAGAATALETLLPAVGPDTRPLVLYRLADLERRLARHTQAEAHALESASGFDRRGDSARASQAWNLAGMQATTLGRFAVAADRFTRAMAQSAAAADWSRHAEQQVNLGTVHFLRGQYDRAAQQFSAARTLAESHAGEPWAAARVSLALANQAALYQRVGRYAQALDLYRAMLAGGAALPLGQQAQLLVNQGALFRRLGDPYKALAAYAEARTAFSRAEDAANAAAAATNRGIALALDLARPDEAISAFDEAIAAASAAGARREALLARLYRGETRRRAGDLAAAHADFSAALAEARALDAREETWKAHDGLGRVAWAEGRRQAAGAAFDAAIVVIEGLREQLSVPSTRAEFFQDKRDVYDARIAAGLGVDPPATTFALIEGSRARAWRDRAALPAVTLDAVQRRLPPGSALLAYWVSDLGAAVVRVARDAASVHPLSIDRTALARFDRALRGPATDEWRALAATLGAALVPAGVRGGASRLVVVPDGPLGAVPFDALVADGRAVLETTAVSVLPTAALLAPPVETGAAWLPPWTPTLAAFGDPRPSADPWAGDAAPPVLPASAAEVRAIAATLGGRHQVFLAEANTTDALRGLLAAPPPILHLATHAVADLAAGERSRVVFSPGADGQAGALFAREIYGLPLDGVDLAVLSACETERGPDVRGEGVQGFSRALLAAGARRAVTTLWRVPDGPTAMLMAAFYREVQGGATLDLALAAAKRALRDDSAFAHPHYWAAFVLTGATDARPRTLAWRQVGGATAIVAGLVAAMVAWRRRAA